MAERAACAVEGHQFLAHRSEDDVALGVHDSLAAVCPERGLVKVINRTMNRSLTSPTLGRRESVFTELHSSA